MEQSSCAVCGGDGQLNNSFGSSARCPACHGTGRRSEDTGFRDVTKTKPSHHVRAPIAGAKKVDKIVWPTSFEGGQLAEEVKACAGLSNETKARLTREIIDHEAARGSCTQTFTKKLRKQLRPAV